MTLTMMIESMRRMGLIVYRVSVGNMILCDFEFCLRKIEPARRLFLSMAGSLCVCVFFLNKKTTVPTGLSGTVA